MSAATCERIGDDLVAFLDDELAAADRTPVADHVATCLVCRREIDRLTTVRRLVQTLPGIEPSPTFADEFWRRMDGESAPRDPRVRPLRPMRWALPALAAAAVVALALHSLLGGPAPNPATAPGQAPAPAARVAAVPPPRAQHEAPPAQVAAQPASPAEAPQVADVESLRPEDLPPELVEHPELFLRLPVVRRLEKLQYLGSAPDRQAAPDDAG